MSRILSRPADDEYELEAERIAAQPMGAPAPPPAQPVVQDSTTALTDAAEELTFMADERVRRRR